MAVDDESGAALGFVHCGFGPKDPTKNCWSLDRSMGTLALICCGDDPEVTNLLVTTGVDYLKAAGAKVIYAGGRSPLNPFYWGLYGGSEFSGILTDPPHPHTTVVDHGFRKVAESVIFEFDLSKPEPRHVSNAILRRESRFLVQEDELTNADWTSLALDGFHTISIRITGRNDPKTIAAATLWPMSLYGRQDGLSRMGLIDVFVESAFRRRGYGRLLLTECIKCVAELGFRRLCVQTDAANQPAETMYQRLGFDRVGSASLYRLEQS
jgi:GNAT superfamily N-acetyltransferase